MGSVSLGKQLQEELVEAWEATPHALRDRLLSRLCPTELAQWVGTDRLMHGRDVADIIVRSVSVEGVAPSVRPNTFQVWGAPWGGGRQFMVGETRVQRFEGVWPLSLTYKWAPWEDGAILKAYYNGCSKQPRLSAQVSLILKRTGAVLAVEDVFIGAVWPKLATLSKEDLHQCQVKCGPVRAQYLTRLNDKLMGTRGWGLEAFVLC